MSNDIIHDRIDWDQLREVQELVAELAELGIKPQGYDLSSPWSRPPATPDEQPLKNLQ